MTHRRWNAVAGVVVALANAGRAAYREHRARLSPCHASGGANRPTPTRRECTHGPLHDEGRGLRQGPAAAPATKPVRHFKRAPMVDGIPAERYWLEITDRADLGVDLKAPQAGDGGTQQWSYSLVKEASDGDVVFHYWKPAVAITSWSVVDGEYWEEDIVWASHGTVAREAGVVPYRRPGWRRGLRSFTALTDPVSLEAIRQRERAFRGIVSRLEQRHGRPIYFPFALSDRRSLRPTQCYLTKLPEDVIVLFDALAAAAVVDTGIAAVGLGSGSSSIFELGTEYRPAAEEAASSERDAFAVDPAVVERGLRGHARTQNALAAFVRTLGCEPRSPLPTEPNFDLAWTLRGTRFVAEVKSTTESNAEKQMRLGLGQVLRYRQLLAPGGGGIVAVLAIESAPVDVRWQALSESVGVRLVWPPRFSGL